MKNLILVMGCLAFTPESALAAEAVNPQPISPGSDERVEAIATTCPSFSWSASVDPDWFELAVFEVEDGVDGPSVADLRTVAVLELPGGGRSWTPSMDRCVDPGKPLVWFIRSHSDKGPSQWSAGRWFVTPRSVPLDRQAILGLLDVGQAAYDGENVASNASSPRKSATPQRGANIEMTAQGELIAGEINVLTPAGSIVTQTTAASEANGRLRASRISLSNSPNKTGIEVSDGGNFLQFVTTASNFFCAENCADLEVADLFVNGFLNVRGPITFANGFTGYRGDGGGGFFEVPSTTSVRVDTNPSDCNFLPVLAVRLNETDSGQIGIQVNCSVP